jgi:hypothetical protein
VNFDFRQFSIRSFNRSEKKILQQKKWPRTIRLSIPGAMFVEHFSIGAMAPAARAVTFQMNPLLCKLSPSDQADYLNLVNLFAYSDDRNKRNLGMATFVKHLSMIHSFVVRGDRFDCLRGVVCGIEFGVSSFLINTSKLKKLMFRSKSCMNGCFQRLGYSVCRPAHDITTLFAQIMPGSGSHLFAARQWCVRKATDASSLCFIPNTKVELGSPSGVCSPPPSPLASSDEDRVDRSIDLKPSLFRIESLLNRQTGPSGIHRMTFEPLTPVAC